MPKGLLRKGRAPCLICETTYVQRPTFVLELRRRAASSPSRLFAFAARIGRCGGNGSLTSAPPPLACNNLVASHSRQNRLHQAMFTNRIGQFAEGHDVGFQWLRVRGHRDRRHRRPVATFPVTAVQIRRPMGWGAGAIRRVAGIRSRAQQCLFLRTSSQ